MFLQKFSFIFFALNAAPESNLDLKTTIQLVMQVDPALQQAKEKLKEADAKSWLAISETLPSIDASLTYQRKKDSANAARPQFGGDSYNYYQSQISGSQPLLVRGFFSGISGGQKEKSLGEIDYEIVRRDLMLDTVKLFYLVVLSQRKVDTLKKALKVHEQSLSETQHRLKIGRGQRLDMLQVKTEVAKLNPQIQKAEYELKSALAELAKEIGKSDTQIFQVQSNFKIENLVNFQNQLKDTASQVPELDRARLRTLQLENANTVLLGKHWPRVDFEGNLSWVGFRKNDLADSDAMSWGFGVSLKVPLFSGLSYFHERNQFGAQEATASLEEENLTRNIRLDQLKALENLHAADSIIRSSQIAYNLAAESLEEARKSYKVSNIDYLQFLTTEESLLDSELSLEQAKYDFIVVLTNYFKAWGYKPDLLIDLLTA